MGAGVGDVVHLAVVVLGTGVEVSACNKKVPDPAIFVIDLQDTSKKLFLKRFSAYYLMKVHLYNFSNIKSHKVTKQ